MADNARRFTKEWLSGLKPKAREIWYDTGCHNLTVRVGTGDRGTKVFYWFGRVAGTLSRIKIGVFPDMPIDRARDEAKSITGQVAQGIDPMAKTTAAKNEMTIGKLFHWYLEMHSKPHKKTWNEDVRRYDRNLAHWRNVKISRLTKSMVKDHHVALSVKTKDGQGGTYCANKMLELLRHMYHLAHDQLDVTVPNPTLGLRRFPKTERERYLTTSELPRFLEEIKNHPKESTRDFIYLALFTGARRSNVAAMRWDEIDMHEKVWRIPGDKSKSGKLMAIPLTEAAMFVLNRRAQAQAGNGSPWVLPGPGTSGHVIEPKHAIKAIASRAKIKDLRFHDLRRTLGSWQVAQGTSLSIIGKSLGHNSLSSTRVYARLDIDPVREATEKATSRMLAAVLDAPAKKSKK